MASIPTDGPYPPRTVPASGTVRAAAGARLVGIELIRLPQVAIAAIGVGIGTGLLLLALFDRMADARASGWLAVLGGAPLKKRRKDIRWLKYF